MEKVVGTKRYTVKDLEELKKYEQILFSFSSEVLKPFMGLEIIIHCEEDNRDYKYRVIHLLINRVGSRYVVQTYGEEPPLKENVNHPDHYTQGDIECIDAIKAATVNKTGIEAACVGNVIKYLWRYEAKNGVEDVRKAKWYLDRLLKEVKEREDNERTTG